MFDRRKPYRDLKKIFDPKTPPPLLPDWAQFLLLFLIVVGVLAWAYFR